MEAGSTAPHGLVHLLNAGDETWASGQTIRDNGIVIFLKVFQNTFATERIVLVVLIIIGVMEDRLELTNEFMAMAKLIARSITDQLFVFQMGQVLRKVGAT